jgi:predicted dehydrogenase
MSKRSLNRREFLKNSALTATSLGLLPWLAGCKTTSTTPQKSVHTRVRGANEDIRIAVVGFHGRGKDHLDGFQAVKGVRIAGLCDVDSDVLGRNVKDFADKNVKVAAYKDIRRLLEDPDIDAISIATPNHWHSLAAIWAIQAGKDVYVEKPVSHNVWEGRQLVKAARKYDRIVQTGTQMRSSTGVREAVEWIHAGNLGKIKIVRGLCYKRRESIGKTVGPQPVPASVDFDLWTGPAPIMPLRRKRLHYDWHWAWQTGNGDLGNQGIHQMDVARWFLGATELSPSVLSIGGRLGYEDDGETPNTDIVFHDYATAPLIFEVRGLPMASDSDKMNDYRGARIGVVVECEHGYAVNPSYTEVKIFDNDHKLIKQFDGKTSHFANFIDAVRSRKSAGLHADILEGHLSSALCHTGNISYRLGQPVQPDPIRTVNRDHPEFAEAFGRIVDHLGANGVDLAKTPLRLGQFLKMDPKTERFIDNKEANAMLGANYRTPFVLPEKV